MKHQRSTVKAMVMRNHYHKYNHNLTRLLQDPAMKSWWEQMSNAERTYVLKGRTNG
jgi:hypothetical protein